MYFGFQIGEEIIRRFPDLPSQINTDGKQEAMKDLRQEIATTIFDQIHTLSMYQYTTLI